ncbi:protein of unknown function DUF4009 [Penicillium expansum]|uniref:Carrier domain-containing protein n=1 Tax=Penicillium expansum TaxID=27334 RepID=A0A0A2K312_PENEN|nr:protein of unknown function DUF4009 [Penicillium expansum]KGO62069.1 protein of unknown function DUF4009 [Penicillium expansum]
MTAKTKQVNHSQRDVGYTLTMKKDIGTATQEVTSDLEQLSNNEDGKAFQEREKGEISLLNDADMLKLADWNRTMPTQVDWCVHHQITEQCQAQPNAPAVCAWDGNFTYGEIDQLSTALAVQLAGYGVGPEMFVPLCFEKSCWTAVAILGVLKAGAAFALLDCNQPQSRLQELCDSVNATLVLSSRDNKSRSQKLADTVIVLSRTMEFPGESYDSSAISFAQPHNAVYASFTSGSTGKPKVVVVEHSAYCSNVLAHSKELHFDKHSRVLQSASYAFGASIMQIVTTLMVGGCVCVPSESECLDNIAAAARKLQVNWALFTPSALRTIQQEDLSCLKHVVLVGEPPAREDIAVWADHTQVMKGYGSAECSVCCAVAQDMKLLSNPQSIGRMAGGVSWVVDADNHHKLVPLGVVGELIVEGPILARGYLNDTKKTTEAFIDPPSWFSEFCERYNKISRCGRRLYKTGDLVRYDADGSLLFIGRKDTQVKIRGQRVELGEVEHHVRQGLAGNAGPQAVAEVVTPLGSDVPMLVAFIAIGEEANESPDHVRAALAKLTQGVEDWLMEHVPRYMVPSVYIAVDMIPMTATGKTDRRQLRELGGALTLEQLAELQPSRSTLRVPTTALEEQLHRLWTRVLKLPPNRIGVDDSFLRIGGDSITAVQLVAAAREDGLSLTVADIFSTPRLSDMAHIVKIDSSVDEHIAPFSLLQPGIPVDLARTQVALQCKVDMGLVEDIFPCTPLQEGMLSMNAKRAGAYISQNTLELRGNVDIRRLERAWQEVVAMTPILRTRVVDLVGQGLVQVVVAGQAPFVTGQNLRAYLQADKNETMGLGKPLARFAIMDGPGALRPTFVWTAHHALFDGWSMPIIFKQLEQAYHGHTLDRLVPFQGFIKHILQSGDDTMATEEYWQSQLGGCEPMAFPSLPLPDYEPRADEGVQHYISQLQWPRSDITASTAIRAAWAILLAQYTNSPDVIFGATVTGRHQTVPGIERIAAPTIATVPLRIRWSWEDGLQDLLQQVQTQASSMTAYEQMGLQRIRRISPSTEQACQFQTLLVVQPAARESETPPPDMLFEVPSQENDEDDESARKLSTSNTYACMVECHLGEDSLQLRVNFDSRVIEKVQVQRIAWHLEHLLREICVGRAMPIAVGDLVGPSAKDHHQLQEWNGKMPAQVNRCVHALVAERCQAQPAAPAVCAWDGDLTYGELDVLSSALAAHLAERGVGPEVFVPVCFEKSRWTIVAMLGVMKAGGAFVLLDPSHPRARRQVICRAVSAELVVASASQAAAAAELIAQVVVVGDNVTTWQTSGGWKRSSVTPDNSLYTIFTSGSTGTPKGVVVPHAAFASGGFAHGRTDHLTAQSRVFQFSSYAFDVSIIDILTALIVGSCICVPSEASRRDDITKAASQLRVTWAQLTPSTAKLLRREDIPTLQTLVLAGEAVTLRDIEPWIGHVKLVNGYGPAECSGLSSIHPGLGRSDANNIGWAPSSVFWIVNRDNHEQLVPIGAVGELLIEGPIVGRGYLNNPVKTAEAFINLPAWLQEFRRKSNPQAAADYPTINRLYKTGDLVRYAADGSMRYLGRKDTQVKLRGQRIEVGEVEYHTRECFPGARDVVVEVVTPAEAKRPPMLVAFVWTDDINGAKSSDTKRDDNERAEHKADELLASPTDAFRAIIPRVEAGLHDAVPSYMVPAVFLPLVAIPLTATGKTDRRRLRERAATLTRAEMEAYSSPAMAKRAPATAAERTLQQLWARVLHLAPDSIGADDSFFRVGGDSISAMYLVGLARGQGFELSVSQVFALRQLSVLAKALIKSQIVDTSKSIDPFSLLDPQQKSVILHSRPSGLSLTNDAVLDIIPVTDSQVFFLTQWSLSCFSYSIQGMVDADRLRLACHSLVQAHAIMRTVFIKHQGKLLQVVLKSINLPFDHIHTEKPLEPIWRSLCEIDSKEESVSGKPLVKFTLISRSQTEHIFTVRLSHAQYDGASKPMILTDLVAAYNEDIQSGPVCATFPDYVYYCASNGSDTAFEFWKDCLQGSAMTMLPCLDLRGETLTDIHETAFGDLPSAFEDITIPILVNAAFSFILSNLTQKDDVVFGVVMNTRTIPLPQVQTILGPCINLNPLRAPIAQVSTVYDLCRLLRDQYTQSVQFSHLDFSDIRAKSTDWPLDTKLGCIVNHLGGAENSPLTLGARANISDSLVMSRINLEDQLLIRSIPGDGKLQVQVLTSNKIMVSEQAGLLAKRLIETVNVFARSPEALLSSMCS